MNNLIERLKDNNCDVDGAVERLGDINLYLMLIDGFVKDVSLTEYITAFNKGDFETAYRHIHSLKGLSASFGFIDLFQISCELTKAIRSQSYSYTKILNERLCIEHKKIIDIITQNS